MGNICGVRKRGLTLQAVEAAMREVLEDRFPGIFVVHGPDSENQSIRVQLREDQKIDDYILFWWYQGDDYPGLPFIGGKHPRISEFGYWLLCIVEYGIAAKLNARVFGEGVGYYSNEEVKSGADKTFMDFVKRRCESIEDEEEQINCLNLIFNFAYRIVPKPLHPYIDERAFIKE
jgi:hypothetical protein